MFWATFAYNRTQAVQVSLGIASVSLSIFITGYYHYLQDPTFHQNAYAILTAFVLFRSIYVMVSCSEVDQKPRANMFLGGQHPAILS